MERLQIDFSKVDTVSIFLGNRCNMSCPYCHKDKAETSTKVSDRLRNILVKLNDIKIFFYGGEPTLYMDVIKEIVSIKPDASYYITTNGKDFDKFQEYFNEHNFYVVFSYDGESSFREYDPLTKPIAINRMGVSSTLTSKYCHLKQWAKDINHKEDIIKRPIYAYPHVVHTITKNGGQYALSGSQIDNLVTDEIKVIGQAVRDYEQYRLINVRWKSLIALLVKRINREIKPGETRCANSRNIKLDLNGNLYECLYKREPYIGPPTQCNNCTLFKYCGSGCSKEIYRELECRYNKLLLGWFVNFYKEHKEACDEIVRFSKPDDSNG